MLLNLKSDGALVVAPYDVEDFKPFDGLKGKEREEAIRPLAVTMASVLLIPGWNEIPDDVWFKCRTHLQKKIDSGVIEELIREEEDADGNKKYVGVTISDFKNRKGAIFSPNKLVEVIRGCGSVPTLTRWLDEETRDEMRAEIKKRIEFMNTPENME